MAQTRIDVDVNTGNAQNKLRELSDDVNRINNQVNTESASGGANSGVEDAQRSAEYIRRQGDEREKQIRREYDDARKANYAELQEYQQKHKTGKISDTELEDYRAGFKENTLSSFGEQREDIAENTQRTNELIEELIGKQDDAQKNITEKDQRDNSESVKGPGGILQNLFGKRSELMDQRLNATTEKELKGLNKELEQVNRDIIKKSGGKGGMADILSQGGRLAETAMTGDAMGVAQHGVGMLAKMGPWGIAAAITAGIVGGGIALGNKRDEQIANLTSYRALGDRDVVNASVEGNDRQYIAHGLKNAGEFINKRKELLTGAGRYQAGSEENTMFAQKLERGYGVNSIAAVSGNERQDLYAKSTAENTVEMINVLTAIKNGSISKDDFTLVNEKSQLMYRLQNAQVGSKEKFDNTEILGLMSAFEKMGGEGKDQRAGDFIQGTINAMGEGGGKNMMLLKNQFALKAHPELAGDPAALNRMIEENTDPAYHRASLEGLSGMFGGNKQNEYFGFKDFFGNNLTPSMRDKLAKGAKNEDVLGAITGGANLPKSNIASEEDAAKYSYSKTQGTTEIIQQMSSDLNSVGSWLKSFFRDPVPVTIQNKDLNKVPYPRPEEVGVPGAK